MENRNGLLFTHNLKDFWDSLPSENRDLIIQEFKLGPSLWDFNSLFVGFTEGSLEHGSISLLDLLLNNSDLTLCDLFFDKFLTYQPETYLDHSFWGSIWMNSVQKCIDLLKSENLELANKYESLTPEIIYWKDAHYFISNYSKKVYKLYLDGICDIKRFEDAVMFEIKNNHNIHSSVVEVINCNCRNSVFEQYLIYLEKNKQYQKCVDLMNSECFSLWSNDNTTRMSRCLKHLDKIYKNGNKS
jgi:hypothetical protein